MRTYSPLLAVSLLFVSACGSSPGTSDSTFAGTMNDVDPSTTGSSTPTTGDPVPTTGDASTSTSGASEGLSTGDTDDSSTGDSSTSSTGDSSTGDSSTGEPACVPGAFISHDEALAQIELDLSGLEPQARPFTRYVSLVQLHNAGLCEPDIAVARRALGKLLNALSSEPSISLPTAIDDAELLLRIDLREYGWQAPVVATDLTMYPDTWEMLARTNLHAIEPAGEVAIALEDATGTEIPLLPADALVAAASLPPLYHDALRLPTKLDQLAQQLEVDLDAQIASEFVTNLGVVGRAALHESRSAQLARVVERQELPNAAGRVLWRTFDFGSLLGQSNPFAHPFDFDFDVSEVLFTLPNGLHGYMIIDEFGDRIDEMPANIENDPGSFDGFVHPGLSCMGCHVRGVIAAKDDLRFELDNGMSEQLFDDATKDKIRDLYPSRDDLDALIAADVESYSEASLLAGVPVDDDEPVTATFTAFDQPLDLQRAAAELWLTPDDLASALDQLSTDLEPLGVVGGTVKRKVFAARFAESVCTLKLGKTPACP